MFQTTNQTLSITTRALGDFCWDSALIPAFSKGSNSGSSIALSCHVRQVRMDQNPVPLVTIKIAGK
jgi:hypothetical protein